MRDCDTALQHSECCQRTQQRRPPMGARCSPFARAAHMMNCCCCCGAAWANVLESDCTHSPCVCIPHSGMTDAHTAITAGRSWQFRPESWWLFPPLHTVTVGSLPRIHARMHRMLCAPPPPSLEEQWAALSALRQQLPARVPPHGPSWPRVREADPTHTHQCARCLPARCASSAHQYSAAACCNTRAHSPARRCRPASRWLRPPPPPDLGS
jgi:hypothetical protein